jgi:hypothetical protein
MQNVLGLYINSQNPRASCSDKSYVSRLFIYPLQRLSRYCQIMAHKLLYNLEESLISILNSESKDKLKIRSNGEGILESNNSSLE